MDTTINCNDVVLSNGTLFEDLDDERQEVIYKLSMPLGNESSTEFYRLLNQIANKRLKLALESAALGMIAEAVEVSHDVGVFNGTVAGGEQDYIEFGDKIWVLDIPSRAESLM